MKGRERRWLAVVMTIALHPLLSRCSAWRDPRPLLRTPFALAIQLRSDQVIRISIFLFAAAIVMAQGTGTITGRVIDQSGAILPATRVSVSNSVTGFLRQVDSQADGTFVVTDIPFHSYQISFERDGFKPFRQTISLRSTVPLQIEAKLDLLDAQQRIDVGIVEKTLLVDAEETGTHIQMNQRDIEKMALSVANRGLEAVIVGFPGFAQNANGAIHPRRAHNQMTFVVDGMPISDQLTGAFANAVDPNIVQTVELFTGNIPAENGNKVSAVANVTTKSGTGTGKLATGSVAASAAGYDTMGVVAQAAGERGKLGYSGSYNAMKSNRYLDQLSLDNLYNGGHSQRGFFALGLGGLQPRRFPRQRDGGQFPLPVGKPSLAARQWDAAEPIAARLLERPCLGPHHRRPNHLGLQHRLSRGKFPALRQRGRHARNFFSSPPPFDVHHRQSLQYHSWRAQHPRRFRLSALSREGEFQLCDYRSRIQPAGHRRLQSQSAALRSDARWTKILLLRQKRRSHVFRLRPGQHAIRAMAAFSRLALRRLSLSR